MRSHLKGLRNSMNWTQVEVATKLGISLSFYVQIEGGQRDPTISLARKIADLFGCSTIDEVIKAS